MPDCQNPDVVRRNVTINSKNRLNVPIKVLQDNTRKEAEFLLSKDSVNNYEIMYECSWQRFKKENKLLVNQFWKRSKLDPRRPLSRLVPRCSIRSGFNELYKLKAEATETECLYYYDCNSLYSYIARDMYFPVGPYEVVLEKELQQHLQIVNKKFVYKGEDCSCDVAHVSLLAPRDLYAPFLSYRFGDASFNSLCFKCVTVKNTTGPCRHKCPYKRRFSSTYTVIEIEMALSLGYELLFCYELYHFSQKEQVLRDYIKVISSLKLKATDLFSHTPESDRQAFCDELNVKMKFDEPQLQINSENVQPNPSQKQYLKDLLNSLFGRFALNSNHSIKEFVKTQAKLDLLMASKDCEILDFFPVNDDTLQVEYLKTGAAQISREGNLFYTALINAQARIFMYKYIQKLTADGCSVIYIDTDSLLFSGPSDYQLPFGVTPAFGDFKPVLGPTAVIKKFFALGCKNYCILYNDSDQTHYVTKIKGLSLGSYNLKDKITPSLYETFINANFEKQVITEYIPQSRSKLEKQTRTFKQIMLTQKFSSELHLKRFILKREKTYITYPYGFNFCNVSAETI